jgi:hypothetical protein
MASIKEGGKNMFSETIISDFASLQALIGSTVYIDAANILPNSGLGF